MASSSKVQYLPYVEKGLIGHAILMVLLGLAYAIAMLLSLMEGEEAGVIGMLLCLSPATVLIGGLQLFAGLQVRKRRGRALAIVAALLGSYGSCIAFCLPASLLFGVFVLVVLLDSDVRAAFDAA